MCILNYCNGNLNAIEVSMLSNPQVAQARRRGKHSLLENSKWIDYLPKMWKGSHWELQVENSKVRKLIFSALHEAAAKGAEAS